MKKVILHHIASDFGKSSTIGYRSEKIYQYYKEKLNITIICRSKTSDLNKKNNIWSIYLSFLFSRFFTFLRVYILYNFPSRDYELFIFNFLSTPLIIFHYFKNKKNKRYFHSWDTSYWLLVLVKKLNYFIIKDCAMTPSKSSLNIYEEFPNFYPDKNTDYKKIEFEKKIFKISSLIISPSRFTTNFIINEYQVNKRKLKTIPFGVDFKKYSGIRVKDKNIKTPIRLGFVGLVNMRKGIRWLINVLNLINEKERILIELHLFGRIYKEEIKTLNQAKFKVIKYGFVESSKTNIYKNFDLLIHPSFIEGSAKCIYEAMAAGLPIICTRESGSIVQNKKNGLIIKAGDTDSLISSIKFFLYDLNKLNTMGMESQKIIKNYSWEKYARNVINNYKY